MKKASILLALALLAVMLAPAALAANSGSCGTNITWKYSSGTLTITCNGEGRMKDYNSFDGAPWYSLRNNIHTVKMTGYITYIGKYNFYAIGASDGADYTLPDTVTTIGDHAFLSCNVNSMRFPRLLTEIQDSAFESCSFSQGIAIPEGVETIPYRSFYGCHAASLTLPSTLKTIEFNAFTFLNGPSSIDLPEGLESLGSNAFYNCNTLTEVTIPASITSYENAFGYCYNLEAIHVAPGSSILSSVDGVLFDKEGTKLLMYPIGKKDESYTVPAGVTELAGSAFAHSPHLKSVTLPDGLTALSGSAFYGCTALTHVDFPASLTSIGNSAFGECTALTEMTIPRSVTTLGNTVFFKSTVSRVTIPPTVETLGTRVFDVCPADLTLCVVAASPAHDYALENNQAVEYLSPFEDTDFTLPVNLKSIEDSAFEGVDAAIVIIPDGMTTIGSRAFASCPNLKHISIPDSVTTIDGHAFDEVNSLYLYGTANGPAQTYAASHDNITFIPLTP